MVINGGDKAILPKGAVVKAVIYDGSVTAESSCDNLPPAEAYACFEFIYGVDTNGGSSTVGDGTHLEELHIGTTVYNLGHIPAGAGDTGSIVTKFNAIAPLGLVVATNAFSTDGGQDFDDLHLQVKIPASLASQTMLYVKMNGFPKGLFVKLHAIDCPTT